MPPDAPDGSAPTPMADVDEDELRDLSPEDAQELRAFLDKQRWFEGKLQLLSNLPRILPFVQPHLVPCSDPDASSPVYAASKTTLPSASELSQWQEERDALEEEVLAFDGGDLGRMKEKTRTATLHPLTPPSTHLVAITLDLILLVDRLLTLLRNRYELLELASLRLRWDALRWEIMREEELIRREVRACMTDSMARAKAVIMEPTKETVISLRSTHRSQYKALSSRQRTLTNGAVSRASATLDAMIDRAAPLKGLGGLDGSDDEEEGGAVPEVLLDIQDELEGGVATLEEEVEWAKRVDERWISMEEASIAASNAGVKLRELERTVLDALSKPATSVQHRRLEEVLHGTRLTWAGAGGFESRVDHPEVGEADQALLVGVTAAQDKTREAYGAVETIIAWYGRISTLTDALRRTQEEMRRCADGLRGMMMAAEGKQRWRLSHLDKMHSGTPSGDEPAEYTHLLDDADAQLLSAEATLANASATLDGYRCVMLDAPSRHPPLPDPYREQDLLRAVDLAMGSLRGDITAMRGAVGDSLRRDETMPVLIEWLTQLRNSEEAQRGAEERIYRDVTTAAWRMGGMRPHRPASGQGDLSDDPSASYKAAMEVLHRDATLWRDMDESRHAWIAKQEAVDNARTRIDRAMRVLERVRKQAGQMNALTREASDLCSRIDGKRKMGGVPDELRCEVVRWVAEVPDRVIFVSACASEAVAGVVVAADAARPLRDPAVESDFSPDRVDEGSLHELLARTDREVRGWVNETCARLQAAALQPEQKEGLEDAAVSLSSDVMPGREDTEQLGATAQRVDGEPGAVPDDESSDVVTDCVVNGAVHEAAHIAGGTSTGGMAHDSPRRAVVAPPSDDDIGEQLRQLLRQLRSLRVQDAAMPRAGDVGGKSRRLPTIEQVAHIKEELEDISERVGELGPGVHHAAADHRRVNDELMSATACIPRLEALAAFVQAVARCDVVFGEMMDALASRGSDGAQGVPERGLNALRVVEDRAAEVESDARVRGELKRIREIWAGLDAPVKGAMDAVTSERREESSDAKGSRQLAKSDVVTATPSGGLWSTSGFGAQRPTNVSRVRSELRTASNPIPKRLHQGAETVRVRTVSDSRTGMTPRARVNSLASSQSKTNLRATSSLSATTPRSKQTSGTVGVGTAHNAGRVQRASRLSGPMLPGSPLLRATVSMRHASSSGLPSSRSPRTGPSKSRQAYVPDTQSKLDIAVGHIVNKLQVNVPVVPVTSSSTSRTAPASGSQGSAADVGGVDEWQDQSGRYWIGYEGRAKLCFCRILRSQTVMVRVGGGWVELSKFLTDHFAEATWTAPTETLSRIGTPEMSNTAEWSVPRSITAATLAAAQNTPTRARSAARTSRPPMGQSDLFDPDYNSGSCTEPERGHSEQASGLTAPLALLETVGKSSANDDPPTSSGSPLRRLPRSSSGHTALALVTPTRPSPDAAHRPSLNSAPGSGTASPLTPVGSSRLAAAGVNDGSPGLGLVPLQFIRKASESPPVRLREKERFAGRRSILGKE